MLVDNLSEGERERWRRGVSRASLLLAQGGAAHLRCQSTRPRKSRNHSQDLFPLDSKGKPERSRQQAAILNETTNRGYPKCNQVKRTLALNPHPLRTQSCFAAPYASFPFPLTNTWNCWAYRTSPGSVIQGERQMINRTPPSSANP